MTRLAEAGTTIIASPDQAKRLRVVDAQLEGLLSVSETEKSSIDEKDLNLSDVIVDTTDPDTKSKKGTSAEAELENDELGEVDAHLFGKFVELRDLLPPLPKKGNFDVETIKQSQYFFS